MTYRVTTKEMADIREGKGQEKVVIKNQPKKKRGTEREKMIETLNDNHIDFKGNASNSVLRKLVEGIE